MRAQDLGSKTIDTCIYLVVGGNLSRDVDGDWKYYIYSVKAHAPH
jgi:hypothetical protein